MEFEKERVVAHKLFSEAGISIFPYGNAWWLVGHGVNVSGVEFS